ncbi:MAG: hypothetical protein SFV54_18055 [Bryobacteraceae bacterium]|nr:hypothetical protein [Bryobacteraceae bacterium]
MRSVVIQFFSRRLRNVLTAAIVVHVAATALTPCLWAQQALTQQAKYKLVLDRELDTGLAWQRSPVWRNGMLVGILGTDVQAPTIYTIDRDGRREEFLFTLEEAVRITIAQVSVSRSGELAAVGFATTNDLRGATFVARISPDRKSQIVTRTWPYIPGTVEFASDGTIWTIGHVTNNDRTRDLEFDVLRRFDSTGRLLSTKTVHLRRRRPGTTSSFFQAVRDRVAWFTLSGEYIEFDLGGAEIYRLDGPPGTVDQHYEDSFKHVSMAVTEAGNVIVAKGGSESEPRFYQLDRDSKSWVPLIGAGQQTGQWPRIFGSDGEVILVRAALGKIRRFRLVLAQ